MRENIRPNGAVTWVMKSRLNSGQKINQAVAGYESPWLRWFQYRIIHRILGTGALLNKIGLADSGICRFCREEEETIARLFRNCHEVERFISRVWRELNILGVELGTPSSWELVVGGARNAKHDRNTTKSIYLTR